MDSSFTGNGIYGREIWITGAVALISGGLAFTKTVSRSKFFAFITYVLIIKQLQFLASIPVRGHSAATLNSALNPALNSTLVLWCYSTENSTELSRSMSQIFIKKWWFFKKLGKKMLIFQILTKNDDFSKFRQKLMIFKFCPKFWKIINFCQN